MDFRIAKLEFLRGLRLAQSIADRKSTMPMLANVLLRTQGKNQLLVAATDLNVSLTAELKCTATSEGGITLGAKNLYELIANAPGDDVTLKKADNHWAEIKSGKAMPVVSAAALSAARNSTGGMGNLPLAALGTRLRSARRWQRAQLARFERAITRLTQTRQR